MTIAMLLGHNQKNVQGATWLTDSQFISVNGDWFFISIDFTVDGNNNIELMDIIIDFPDGYRSYISLMMPIELFRLTFDFFISSQGEQAVIIHGQNLNPFTPIFASFRHDFLGNRAPVGRFEISQDFDLRRSFVFNQNIIENLNDRIVILNQINQNLNDAYWELRIEMDGILSNLDEIAGYWFHRYSQLRLEINELNFQIQGHLHHIWYLQREIDTLLRNSIRDMEQIEFLTNEMHHYKNAFEGTFGVIENLSIQLTYTQNQLR
ncbi:MAG: hypothetical protein FWE36_08905, partial [Erysipelotrichales bacterium]|nr:hypothetical protein [Erysipelotrichales bacterium]